MGRWLGPAVDVGPAMTYKVKKSNGHFVFRSSVRHWTPEEEANPDLLREREEFMARLKDNLGRPAKEVDFPLEDLTLNILIMPTTMRTNSQAVQMN